MANQNSTTEIWKPVVGWEKIYDVSSYGRVRRAAAYHRTPNYVMKPEAKRGYQRQTLNHLGRRETRFIHCLVAAAFIGPKPNGYTVNHINAIKTDNRPENLEYATPAENSRHASRHGLLMRGERHCEAKLSESNVLAIRSALANGERPCHLARRFKVSKATIQAVKWRRNWAWLQ